MLRIKDFDISDDCMTYEGINHYFIHEHKKNYLLTVEKLVDRSEYPEDFKIKVEKYTCSTLATAIETIELIEFSGVAETSDDRKKWIV